MFFSHFVWISWFYLILMFVQLVLVLLFLPLWNIAGLCLQWVPASQSPRFLPAYIGPWPLSKVRSIQAVVPSVAPGLRVYRFLPAYSRSSWQVCDILLNVFKSWTCLSYQHVYMLLGNPLETLTARHPRIISQQKSPSWLFKRQCMGAAGHWTNFTAFLRSFLQWSPDRKKHKTRRHCGARLLSLHVFLVVGRWLPT